MVQRYDLIIDDLRQMAESDEGHFVEYEDYEKLRALVNLMVSEFGDYGDFSQKTWDELRGCYLDD